MDFGTIQGFQETQNLESVMRRDKSGEGTPVGHTSAKRKVEGGQAQLPPIMSPTALPNTQFSFSIPQEG